MSNLESPFLSTEKKTMFINRLQKVFKHVNKLARRQNIGSYRVYDHDLPEFPFRIEIYESYAYLSEYQRRHGMTDEEHQAWLEACIEVISEIIGIENECIYIKERKRKANRQDQYQKTDNQKQFLEITENGLKFFINLTDYLDTGLFLDHRITRKMVMDEAKDKRVLNLFAYTGSFSVYAAAGKATSVTTVDLSKTYLQWAENNFNINGLNDTAKYHFINADVKQYLKQLKPNSFDLAIIDPPTFSNSKKMKDILDVQQDHVEMLNDLLNAISEGGRIYFSTNYTRFIIDSDHIKASAIKDITKQTTPFDFAGKLKRWCYLITK